MAFIVCNSVSTGRVMKILREIGVDYFTNWDEATGKGHGTEPRFGFGEYPDMNSVTMIAFEDDALLETLIGRINGANQEIQRAADHIRLFQLPLERIV